MTPDCLTETNSKEFVNQRGNRVQYGPYPGWDGDRYVFDQDPLFNEFKQFDTSQDAPYFGVWTCAARLQTFTYCEGDVTLVTCPDAEHYNAEIRDMIQTYTAAPAFKAMDDKGQWTHYYEDQGEHFAKVAA